MHSLPLCCPGKTVYSYLISQWDILLEDRGQHLEAVRRRMAAHQASPSLGFSMQEHWSGLPFPSPMRESESESEVAQSYPTLSDPMDCGPLGSSIHGIFQITHAGGIQQPCADDADAACGEEPEDSSQQLAQVVMYGYESWTMKKAEHLRIDAFELWSWRRLFRVLWAAKRSNQSILKEISSEYSLEGLMLKLKLQYFGHQMQRTDSLEKTLMLGKIEGGLNSMCELAKGKISHLEDK
ncbi:uncharacterized protein LOC129659367 isoform X4 [Bubalus kerabau]|uniref:uncharacterized protein LOC129659367 isoform X4 n=1 Tax=Bubalus carabanensis TaxID=3119969 RepID=UPI00244EB781|nr:uncharacterized protein LOC129659367 isoform X4 [Bubalus carabanensis]